MKAWHSMFRESDGSVSMTRVCLFLTTVIIVGTWCILSFTHGQVLDIPPGAVTVVLAYCGLKYGQKPHESDGPPAADEEPGR